MVKKLIAHEEYNLPPRNLYYKRGEVFAVDDDLFLFLMADAPGVFGIYTEPKAIDASFDTSSNVLALEVSKPPVNKMMRAPKAKK